MSPETATQLSRLEIAQAVREAAVGHYGNPRLKGVCPYVSAALIVTLRSQGYAAHSVHGYYRTTRGKAWSHHWVASGRRYYDLTASQFRGEPVRVVPKDDPRYLLGGPDDWRSEMEVQLIEGGIRVRHHTMNDAFHIADAAQEMLAAARGA